MGENEIHKFNSATLLSGSNHRKKICAKYCNDCIMFRGWSIEV